MVYYGCEKYKKNVAELKPVGTYLSKGVALPKE